MSKTKAKLVSPTILVITLEADGSASLLTRRGELAHLSQFSYHGLPDVITAIQAGAAQLIELEAHPPAIESKAMPPVPAGDTAPAIVTPSVLDEAETPIAPDEEETDTADGVDESLSSTDLQPVSVPQPTNSLFTPQVPQAKLF